MIDTTRTAADLVATLTLRERAGLLFHPMLLLGDDVDVDARPPWGGATLRELIVDHGIRFFCLGAAPEAPRLRETLESIQELARTSGSRLPIVFSTDPRHSFLQTAGATHAASGVSRWPEPIGFGALRDQDTVRAFADTVRRDYLALGLRMALHPQVDLTTEARWARQAQSFGTDPELTSQLLRAYIEGLQGDEINHASVAATTKHFPGAGPQKDGEDPHFPYGREQVYPGGRFEDHLAPFRAAIAADTAAIMPYYGMPHGLTLHGRPVEEVGFAFNKQIITGLLREELGYGGVVLSDFGLVTDQTVFGKPFPARAWGVEHLDRSQRVARLLDAGIDQLGGESDVDLVLELVERGVVDENRLTASATRIADLQLRLHEPVDVVVPATFGTREQVDLGWRTQARAMTVLRNTTEAGRPVLPLRGPHAVHLQGIDPAILPDGWVSTSSDVADLAIVRIGAPFESRDTYFLEAGMQQGSLEFHAEEIARITALAGQLPVVLVVTLSRPAVLTPIAGVVAALVADYGADDAAVLAALTGTIIPEGRLPFELPRTMAAVAAGFPDVGADTTDPLYPLDWRSSSWA
ncbi:MAG: hypothetical protein K0S37_3769 [Microbacterium sp.]|jgi:beta-glucosidase|nr:hypothetical protein [Microbacterium sp.]